jgi:hypothetical protein
MLGMRHFFTSIRGGIHDAATFHHNREILHWAGNASVLMNWPISWTQIDFSLDHENTMKSICFNNELISNEINKSWQELSTQNEVKISRYQSMMMDERNKY